MGTNMQVPVQSAVKPTAMTVQDMARLLTAAGGKNVTAEQVQADVDAGAPVGADGRLNLLHYTAWLLREFQSR